MKIWSIGILWACTALAMALGAPGARADGEVIDSFEEDRLSAYWDSRTAPASRLGFRKGDSTDGNQALALRVNADDFDDDCKCQRTELREAADYQPEFGSDLWYRFSLKLADISGGYDANGWMLAAWKQEVDGSPFLALRFDGGVFYITFESAETRVMLASTLLDARAFIKILKGGGAERFGFLAERELYMGDSGVTLTHGNVVYLPDPTSGWVDLMVRVRGGLAGRGIIELYANGNFVVRASGQIGVEAPTGSRQYLRLGHRRQPSKTNATLLIDNFRRGPTRSAVEK